MLGWLFRESFQDYGYKDGKSEKKQRELLKELDVALDGWGPYCSNLDRQSRKKLNKREMMKLDVEYKRLEASWLEVSWLGFRVWGVRLFLMTSSKKRFAHPRKAYSFLLRIVGFEIISCRLVSKQYSYRL